MKFKAILIIFKNLECLFIFGPQNMVSVMAILLIKENVSIFWNFHLKKYEEIVFQK